MNGYSGFILAKYCGNMLANISLHCGYLSIITLLEQGDWIVTRNVAAHVTLREGHECGF